MKQKLIVFDLDGTLAPIGKGALPETVTALRQLEQKGHKIAICSGKPVAYLCGYMRQIGLEHPILVGENGACIQFGIDLPPKEHLILPYSDDARRSIAYLREELYRELPHLWYQPNQVALTPFFDNTVDQERITEILTRCMPATKDVMLYAHVDCYDVVPLGITKKEGLRVLLKHLDYSSEDMIAIGDWTNDYPMFELAGLSIGIHLPDPSKADLNVANISEAMQYLLQTETH